MAKKPTIPAAPIEEPQAAQDAGLVVTADPAPPASEPAAEQPEPTPAAIESEPADLIPELDDFIAQHEKEAQDAGLVVTAITHPTAKPRMHPGVYSGFPIATGELSATYSDGSTH